MKKSRLFIPLALAAFAFIAVLRFVEIPGFPPAAPATPKHCAAGESQPSAALTDANGEPLPSCAELQAINQAYLQKIRPIFAAKCLMCHGTVEKLPLYAKVPPFSWLVRYDIREAQEHADMSHDFPFTGKKVDVPQDVLEDLIDVIDENEMPPVIYKIMHWQSGLSQAERKAIRDWANQGLKTLND